MATSFSFRWYHYVNSDHGPKSTMDRTVANALFKYMDSDGRCFPSGARLAKDCRRCPRQIWRSIANLKKAGLLTVPTKRKTRNDASGFKVNHYQGLIPEPQGKLSRGEADPTDTSVIDRKNPPDKIEDPPDTSVTIHLTPVPHDLPKNSHIELLRSHADACSPREREKEEEPTRNGTSGLLLNRLRQSFDGDAEKEHDALVDRFGRDNVNKALPRALMESHENFYAELVAILENQQEVADATV